MLYSLPSRHLVPVLEYLPVGGVGVVHRAASCPTEALGHPLLPGLAHSSRHLHHGPWSGSVVAGHHQCKRWKFRPSVVSSCLRRRQNFFFFFNFLPLQLFNKLIFLVSFVGNQGTFTRGYKAVVMDMLFIYHLGYAIICVLGLFVHEFFYSFLVRNLSHISPPLRRGWWLTDVDLPLRSCSTWWSERRRCSTW